ncbi:uncharacterized protein TNCV_590761 [Trichonephila clavipes]|nr:uncharacterized protein TNCV_590761 [Trichonephila clavipes]
MARTKQITFTIQHDWKEETWNTLRLCSQTTDVLKSKIMEIDFVQSDEQTCLYLTLKLYLADGLRRNIEFLEKQIEFCTPDKESVQIMERRKEAEQKELNTTLGEIALISCPIPNCPHHTLEKIQSLTGVTNLGTINNEKEIEQNSNPKNNNKESDKNPQTHKRTGQEDFKAPAKFARKCIEIPIEKVICTSSNKFAVLEDEEIMDPQTKDQTDHDEDK